MGENILLHTESLPEFFKEKVHYSITHLKAPVSPEVEYYLVNFLFQFAQSDHFYEVGETGQIEDRALATRYFDAQGLADKAKIPVLKKLGDCALFISGFFADSFFRKAINLKYYIGMGHFAYSSVSTLIPGYSEKILKNLFEELSRKFIVLVDVINDVRDSTELKSDQNLLKLYERWLHTGSERIKAILNEQGVIPNECVKTGFEQ